MKVEFAPQFFNDMKRLFSYNPIYSIPRFFSNVRFEIKMAWQRVFKGYDDSNAWSLYYHLNTIIPIHIRKMIKYTDGYPVMPGINNMKQWKDILKKIAKGFEAMKKIEDDVLYKGKRYEKLKKDWDIGIKLFVKYYRCLWW